MLKNNSDYYSWLNPNALYQFIFTTDMVPMIGYPIPDVIPTTLAFSSVNWCKIDVFTLNIMVLMFPFKYNGFAP